MGGTKLVQILRELDSGEIKALDKFIQSTYFNTNPTITRLWNRHKKYAPDFEVKQLTKEKIYKYLFPKEAFNEKKLRQLRSKLFKLIEEFLAVEQFRSDKFLVQKQLGKAYYEKDFYNWFEEENRKLIRTIQEKPIPNENDYLDLTQLHHQLFFNQRSTKHGAAPPDLLHCSEQVSHFNWLISLKYACEWMSRKLINKEKVPDFVEAFALPNKYLNEEYPLFVFYYNIYTIYSQNFETAEELFDTTIQYYKDKLDQLPRSEQTTLLLYLLNYGSIAHRTNETKYLPKIFSLNEIGLNTKILLWKGQMNEISFSNIVFIGSKLEQFDWVSEFMQKYQSYLNPLLKQDTIDYSRAMIAFFQKNYEKTFYQLEKIKFKNLTREVSKKLLQLRSGFEFFLKQERIHKVLLSRCESFRKFISRKDLTKLSKGDAFHNTNETIKQTIILIHGKAAVEQFEKLKNRVLKQSNFVEKKWMLYHLDKQIILRQKKE